MPSRSAFIRRRSFLAFLGVLLPAVLALPPLLRADTPTPPREFALTVLHTNDLHGHVVPFAYTEKERSPVEQPSVGGAARRATLVRQLRRQIKNPVVLVDAGDTFTRGPLTTTYEGLADVEAMNAVGYELAAIGNNEFKAKDAIEQDDAAGAQAALLQVVKRSRFPWLCANATDSRGALLEGVQPYVVREWNDVRVGFLGLTAPRSAFYPQTRGWKITDPIAAANTWIPRARAHCDVLIAVTHLGVDLDRALVAKTRGLDAVVGGDSHTFLYQAVEARNLDGARVPIVQDGEWGVNLGRFDLRFHKDDAGKWSLGGYDYRLLPVGPQLKEAPDVAAVIAPYLRPFQEVVGRLDRIGATPKERQQVVDRLLAAAMHAHSGADLAMTPEDANNQDLFHSPVVRRLDVFTVFPFRNHVVVAELTGAEILRQSRLKPTVLTRDAAALQPGRTYRVAMTDFDARAGFTLPTNSWKDTGVDVREAIIAYLKASAARNGMGKAPVGASTSR